MLHQSPFVEINSCHLPLVKTNSQNILQLTYLLLLWSVYLGRLPKLKENSGNVSFAKNFTIVLLKASTNYARSLDKQHELTFHHHQHDQMDGRNPARSYLHRPHNLLLPRHRCSHMDTFGRPCLCNVRNKSIPWLKLLQLYTDTMFLFHILYKKCTNRTVKPVWKYAVKDVQLTSPASSA